MASIVYKNIFDIVTDRPEEASELQTRSDFMIATRDIIDEQNWTQVEAGEKLGLTRPRVSDLKKGKVEKFSIDLLMTCLFRVGFRFKPSYKNHKFTMDVQAVNLK